MGAAAPEAIVPDYSDAPPRPPWLPNSGPKQLDVEPECWSIRLSQLTTLLDYIHDTDKYMQLKQQHGVVNMYHINDHFLIPWTANLGCSIALLLNPQGLAAEGMPSHAWAENNEEFKDALTRELDGDPALWICTFSQYQPKKDDSIADVGPTVAQQLEIDP